MTFILFNNCNANETEQSQLPERCVAIQPMPHNDIAEPSNTQEDEEWMYIQFMYVNGMNFNILQTCLYLVDLEVNKY